MASKYDRLTAHLQQLPGDTNEVTLPFKKLEAVLGFKLPASASEHRAWWGNQVDARNRPQARAWRAAGYVVEAVHQTSPKWVRFRRSQKS